VSVVPVDELAVERLHMDGRLRARARGKRETEKDGEGEAAGTDGRRIHARRRL
jgi:hypothetical protein